MSAATRLQARTSKFYSRHGTAVVYRRITTLPGPNPAVNPPTLDTLKTSASKLAGAHTITFQAPSVSGRLIMGDAFTVAHDPTVYVIASQSIASGNKFSDVVFTPALSGDVAQGATVTMLFAADLKVNAGVSSFSAYAADNSLINIGDLNVTISRSDLPFEPSVSDKLIINGVEKTIENIRLDFATYSFVAR